MWRVVVFRWWVGGGLWQSCGDLLVLREALFWDRSPTQGCDNLRTLFAYI
jgi:hypothetical protein